jgi:hypothetical protein
VTGKQQSVLVHQGLFGYKDGHRQLACSFAVPRRDEFSLLSLSDNATGVNLSEGESYWTGFPLSESRLYALMRTWAAPEMPRPGCVWTHAIFLDIELIAAIPDLGCLEALFVRPSQPGQYLQYTQPIHTIVGADTFAGRRPPFALLAETIQQVYSAEQAVLVARKDQREIDAAVFALWSQQWPRLRMSFSFQTGKIEGRIERGEIQLTLRVSNDRYGGQAEPDKAYPHWVELAAADGSERQPSSPLRKFLWRYGSDINRARSRFRVLVQIYETTLTPTFKATGRESIVDEVFNEFPEPTEASLLKRDLLGLSSPNVSLVPSVPIIDVLRTIVGHNELSTAVTPEIVRERLLSLPETQVTDRVYFPPPRGYTDLQENCARHDCPANNGRHVGSGRVVAGILLRDSSKKV